METAGRHDHREVWTDANSGHRVFLHERPALFRIARVMTTVLFGAERDLGAASTLGIRLAAGFAGHRRTRTLIQLGPLLEGVLGPLEVDRHVEPVRWIGRPTV